MSIIKFNAFWIVTIFVVASLFTLYHSLFWGIIVSAISFIALLYIVVATTVARSKYNELKKNEKVTE